jgi:uncharacterized Zn-binding protein involved in type VI secretion
MPGAALSNGVSKVAATDGAKGAACGKNVYHWNTPTTQASASGSDDVKVNGIGVVREDDTMTTHPDGEPCVPAPVNHTPKLSTFSSTVFANGRRVGRIDDKYNSDGHYSHTIISGSEDVIIG